MSKQEHRDKFREKNANRRAAKAANSDYAERRNFRRRFAVNQGPEPTKVIEGAFGHSDNLLYNSFVAGTSGEPKGTGEESHLFEDAAR